jgi:hypothetical protein
MIIHISLLFDLFSFVGGWLVVVINEIVFGAKKEQLEIDRDKAIKHSFPSLMLAICPRCKSKVPSTSKYCPECGTDLITPTA